MKVSEIYGKQTESTEGKKGYVVSVNASNGKIECLVCADENEKEFVIDVMNIVSAEEKIIYVDRKSAMDKSVPLRLGKAGFNENGMFVGRAVEYNVSDGKLVSAKIGKKNYPAEQLVFGDIILIKNSRTLKDDVKKDGKVLIKKGTPLSSAVFQTAENEGEYVQTTLKSL